jgi:uridine kinase
MVRVLPVYLQVVDMLWPQLRGSQGVIVTIDGRDGVGKTTLGRYLAWYFNVSLIETDLFLIPALDHFIYLDDQINRIIERRVTSPLPVIVEGVAMLELMKRINRVPDVRLYVTNAQHAGSRLMDQRLSAYEEAYAPAASADMSVRIEL